MNIIMVGPPGAGKGTQAIRIAEKFSLPQIATGDIFRKAVSDGTELGKQAKAFMDKGELVPDEVVIGIVMDRLTEDDCGNGFILDGFPRTVAQAEALKERFAETGKEITAVITIEVSEDEILRRLGGRLTCLDCGGTFSSQDGLAIGDECPNCKGKLIQRPDDTDETIKNRLSVYKQSTEPLIEFYQDDGLVLPIEGCRPADSVYHEIEANLTKLAALESS